jgi:hypothetical protein
MALPQSTLSRVCRSIADFLAQRLNANANSIRVLIGTPAAAAPTASVNEHRVNLFFYRIEPSGFFPDVAPDEIWRVRLHCLVTPFGRTEGQTSAGENDLRLLGEIVRVFHETPILPEVSVSAQFVRMEALFHPLTIDEINHLWGTQGDVAYRPSVAYELTLLPVIPSRLGTGSPLVGTTGTQVYGRMDARHAPLTADGATWFPEVHARRVTGESEEWAPAICLVHEGVCVESLSFALGSAALTAFTPHVWVAGPGGTAVTLVWEIWDHALGWRTAGGTQSTIASGEELDPANVADATTASFALPFSNHTGQAVLYAERSFTRASDGAALKVRSNPVLVNLYQA